jgi:PBP superfamily domain
MNPNTQIATAIAAILGTAVGSAAYAQTVTTPTQAAAPTVSLYIAGSSAASKGVLAALETNLCGGNYLLFESTSNKNFFAVSCEPASGVAGAPNATTPYTVWYRDEGGSVVGALPLATGYAPKQLDLTALTSCATNPCIPTIIGASTGNGTDDSFSGALTPQAVQFGILDVEPSIFGLATKNNYPSGYSNAVWNPTNVSSATILSTLTNMPTGTLFDEVYGIFVNNASLTEGGSAVSTSNPLSLSEAMVASILSKSVTNWSLVTDTTGHPVATGSVPIVIVNREQGSGSRAATDLLITGDACKAGGKLLSEQLPITKSGNPNVDYFATGDVLAAANTITGAITYATIDQTASNLSMVSLNGIAPTNAAAAAGQYDFWVEASYVVSQTATFTGLQSSLITFLTTSLQNVGTTPHLVDVLAIPTAANGSSATLTPNTAASALGGAAIYVNPFTRAGTTCSVPSYVP